MPRGGARECSVAKQLPILPLYSAARDRVRMEKGTSMYLAMHRSAWTAVMADLDAVEGWEYAIDPAVLENGLAHLHRIEKRLL